MINQYISIFLHNVTAMSWPCRRNTKVVVGNRGSSTAETLLCGTRKKRVRIVVSPGIIPKEFGAELYVTIRRLISVMSFFVQHTIL